MTNQKSIKSRVIPDLWKEAIDDMIESELVGANRYLAEANPRLGKLVEEVAKLAPQDFYQELTSRWDWHHSFYEELLEPALPFLLEKNVSALTPMQLRLMKEAYRVGSLVDQATLVTSAAIKKHVEGWIKRLPECQTMSDEETYLLMSLPNEPYPVEYLVNHLSYFIRLKESGDGQEMKMALIHRYHAGDEQIFSGRLQRMNHLLQYEAADLKRTQESLRYHPDLWIKFIYLTLERPRLKALQRTLSYDNNEEKRIARELVGISGFVLRKEVIRYLTETKILPENSGIYDYQDSQVDESLDKLVGYRLEVLDRGVAPYFQHGLTCSAACLVMATSHFGLTERSESLEFAIAQASCSQLTDGQHFSGVAAEAVKFGLETVLMHSSPQMFDNSSGWLPQDLFTRLMDEYRCYLDQVRANPLLMVKNGTPLPPSCFRKYLEEGYLVIVAGVLGGGILHAKLLTGYNSSGYVCIDPLCGSSRIVSLSGLETFMDTQIGRWAMALRCGQSTLNRLEKSLSRFDTTARSYLA